MSEPYWSIGDNGLFARREAPPILSRPDEPALLNPTPPTLAPDSGDYEVRDGLWQKKEPAPNALDSLIGTQLLAQYQAAISGWWLNSYSPYSFRFRSNPKPSRPDEVDMTRTEPFVGWKTLSIHVTKKGKLKLLGAGSIKYGIDATAECNRGGGHAIPDWTCSCGFYALSERPDHAECGWFLARVELFGTVIQGEHGWRASRQRVLSLETFRECQGDDGECGKKAAGFQVGQDGKVWPVCEKHAPLGYSTLADLRGKLGTEVSWIDKACNTKGRH